MFITYESLKTLIAPVDITLGHKDLPARPSTGRKSEHSTLTVYYCVDFLFEPDPISAPISAISRAIAPQKCQNDMGGSVWIAEKSDGVPEDILMVDLIHIVDFYRQDAKESEQSGLALKQSKQAVALAGDTSPVNGGANARGTRVMSCAQGKIFAAEERLRIEERRDSAQRE
ncbi:hypothetical protein B0A48_16836 [Cryoendolithus antarcticus]|uniref:Uncharacterized protein n=1 Tax=Cryoendolithus antarcticus TaxID=1507870 RepID=A0A1V8SD00_9PEZI|nr:hypothetical protein B0A48_16836 [Cryoendolithus antarcticus]